MSSPNFDLVTIGGGLGASAIAISMARRGAKVLVLEKELQFRDRVRGEGLAPWGVAEARQLGIADLLLKTCAKAVPWVEMGFGPRNLIETTPQKEPFFTYCHPEMQEVLLAEAEEAGAQVRRGVTVEALEPATNNSKVITRDGKEERISARLVIGVDGRGSAVRRWAGFATQKGPQPFQFAGVLLTGVSGRDDMVTAIFNPDLGMIVGLFPESDKRCRAYLGYPTGSGLALQGTEKLGTFLSESKRCAPAVAEAYAEVKSLGPLATFDVSESWVDHPYREGVALLGDAAATTDPTFGQGMPTALRDARVLHDSLLAHSDWDEAGKQYARLRDIYFHNSHKVCRWFRTLFQDPGPEAKVLRQRAMPLIAQDLTRVPDHLFSGPDLPADDAVRARFFGEC